MNNELVVLEKETALSVLTGEHGVDLLIDHVRDQVMNLEGGNLKTKSGRAAIKSNAFKATKAKTAANKVIDDLINVNKKAIEEKTKSEVAIIEKLKQSKKELGAGLDKIRADVNEEVKKIEDEIQAEHDRIAAEEEAERRRIEIENCLELAHYMNADFDKAKLERIEAEKREREVREEALRKEGEAKARLEAEERERAAQLREQQLIEQAKIDAEKAELKRIADIALAKQAEIDRRNAEAEAEKAEKERLAANEAHVAAVNSMIKETYLAAGFSEELAVKAVKLLVKGKVPHANFSY